jgi:hypothetical protein
MPPNNPFKATVKSGRTGRHQLLTLLVGGVVMLLVTMVLLFRSHHQDSGPAGANSADATAVPPGWPPLRHVRNNYASFLQKPPGAPPLPVREVIKKQMAAIDEWAAGLDSEGEGGQGDEAAAAEGADEPSYRYPLPAHRSIHEVIQELFQMGEADPGEGGQQMEEVRGVHVINAVCVCVHEW